MDLDNRWGRLLASLSSAIGHQEVDIWFRGARAVKHKDDKVDVEVQNRYYADWIRDNYLKELEKEALDVFGTATHFQFTFPDGIDTGRSDPSTDMDPVLSDDAPRGIGVNVLQTFDSFVVGKCNDFAHAAAQAVADAPARNYNPLFIYGSTGLGKTHLMHAIGNAVIQRYAPSRVVYVTAEDFMNEMINCIRYKRMEDFRDKYRKRADALLVDDIQFLSGKDRTQEEFFFTFNALQGSGRQIVLTSDVLPRDIEKLEPRLRTRFEGGLLADMQAPDKETLLAILAQKSDAASLSIPADLGDAIANTVEGNIRELEGIVNQLAAHHAFYSEPITLEFARRRMPNIFSPAPPIVTVPAIIEAVARFHALRSADIVGTKRTRALTRPRHIAMYMARKHTQLSFPELGREFGGRDHSTIQHGFRKVAAELKENADLSYKIQLIEQSLNLR